VSTYTQDYAENSPILKPFLHKFTPLLMPVTALSSRTPTMHDEIPDRVGNDNITIAQLNNKEKEPNYQLPVTNYQKILLSLKQQGCVLFGFAGRFVEEKGFDLLFEAIPEIMQRIPHAHFVFAGETNMGYERFFEKQKDNYISIQKHLTMLGLLNDEALPTFYKTIDFIVLPSRSDCFNLVQAESCLAGTPAIASNIPGLRYLVKATGFGQLFEPNNPHDLAIKLTEAVEKREKIMNNYSHVLTILDTQKNAAAIKDYFTK
jgi:glycosyltransferase involved in cell wall biosynthesis